MYIRLFRLNQVGAILPVDSDEIRGLEFAKNGLHFFDSGIRHPVDIFTHTGVFLFPLVYRFHEFLGGAPFIACLLDFGKDKLPRMISG